ncbi:MAG: nucleotidyltransferase domain-containing protein [bacterium]
MAARADIKDKAKKFLEEIHKHKIRVSKAYLYGSYAKGEARQDSDIDIAIISPDFSGNRYFDTLKIISMRRNIDCRIEPVTYKPEDFEDSDPLVAEIKSTGMEIK